MTYQAVVVGDIHLDGMTADLGPDANRLQIAEIAAAEKWAVRNGIDEIIYPGDICNKAVMSYEAHELLCNLWNTNTHLKRRVIPGNHDYAEIGKHSLKLLKRMSSEGMFGGNVFIYDEPTQVEVDGIRLNMLAYPYPNAEVYFSTANCVNVAHFEVKGSKRDNGGPSSSQIELDEGDGYWIMGHLHTPHEVGNVHYVGTQFQRNFGESLPKSFSHLRARMKGKTLQVKVERIAHEPRFRLINLHIEQPSDLKKVVSNSMHLYKLFISAAVKVPDQFFVDHPNVVRHDNYRTKRERDALVHQKIVVSECEDDDPFETLGEYLTERHPHLNKKQLSRADKIMDEIKSAIEAQPV